MNERDNLIEDNGEEVILLMDATAPLPMDKIKQEEKRREEIKREEARYEQPWRDEVIREQPKRDGLRWEQPRQEGLRWEQPKQKPLHLSEIGEEFEPLDDSDDPDDYEESAFSRFFSGKGVMIAGILVALIALAAGVFLFLNNTDKEKPVDISVLGNKVAAIGTIGEANIYAITEAAAARMEDLKEAVKDYNYNEADSENGVTTVNITLTTILKDMKIKFVNSKDKLIAKVPFQVEVTDPNGKKSTWIDEDKDGIIYETGLEGGSYYVKLIPLDGYNTMYDFSTASDKSVSVKTQLDYQKVDVTNEIKKSNQVDTEKEDTAAHDTAVESTLSDTVAYATSARVASDGGFTEIDRSNIADPVTAILNKNEVRLPVIRLLSNAPTVGPINVDNTSASGNNEAKGTATLTAASDTIYIKKDGEASGTLHTTTIIPTVKIDDPGNTGAYEDTKQRKFQISDLNVATIEMGADGSAVVTAVGVGTAKVFFSTDIVKLGKIETIWADMEIKVKEPTAGSSQTPSTGTTAASIEISSFTIDKTTLNLKNNDRAKLSFSVSVTIPSGSDVTEDLSKRTYHTSDINVAVIEPDGTVVPKGEGTAILTFTAELSNRTKATSKEIKVTVTDGKLKVALNYSTAKVVFIGGDTFKYTATVTGYTKDSSVKWYVMEGSDKIEINRETGEIKALAEGTAKICAAASEDQSIGAYGTVIVLKHPKNDTT
ncbi:MAG: hypothetical protein K6E19_03515, partial [Lachnospiraceae bacterium]|nr:hypothetical protein [Lachnospiraceae bacterium]